jgi:hypothetical protein
MQKLLNQLASRCCSSERHNRIQGQGSRHRKRLQLSLEVVYRKDFDPTERQGHQGRRGKSTFKLKFDASLRNGLSAARAAHQVHSQGHRSV